jgi:hypothetical protein
MKKFLIVMTTVLVALAFAMPAASADFKMTWSGVMEVRANLISNDVVTPKANDSTNAWYYQKLVIEPVFHINDKVRIHNKVTIMERTWNGAPNEAGVAGNYSFNHNFWWEQCYLSFPLFDGHLYVGRMSGGGWAYPFMDDPDNRDRIKYVRKVGHMVLLGVIEKLSEADGAMAGMGGGAGFATADTDIDAIAVGAIIPFSKNVVFKPLLYWVNYGGSSAGGVYSGGANKYLTLNGLMIKAGNFQFDTEIDYIWGDGRSLVLSPDPEGDFDWKQLMFWAQGKFTFGPGELALGLWYIQGDDKVDDELNTSYGMGNDFQPLLILTGEDASLLGDINGGGTRNGAGVAGVQGSTGMWAGYLSGAYKISDVHKLSAILGYIQADTVDQFVGINGKKPDKEFGWEFDLGLDWQLMPNLTWTNTMGYLFTGEFF